MDQNRMSNSHRGPSIDETYHVSVHLAKLFQSRRSLEIDQSDASYQVSVHLAKRFQRTRFLEIDQMKQELPMQPYLLMDRDEMSKLYRRPPIDASYQVSVHLAKRFQRRRFFKNQPIRNKNGLWRPCLLTDPDEMSNHNRGLSIDASYQVSVHLAKRFQRRRI